MTTKQVKVAQYQVWRGKFAPDILIEVQSVDKKNNTVKGLGIQSRAVLDYRLDQWYEYHEFVVRPLRTIARDIDRNWASVWFGAVPYLQAMHNLWDINEDYYADSARSVVQYFLGNAATWKGEKAKRIKAELKALVSLAK